MADSEGEIIPKPLKRAAFTATSWTAVMAASNPDHPGAKAALEHLCQVYWYPLYAYVRRKGLDSHTAEDMTQEFFHRLLRENYLRVADRERGKFRSFLLTSITHFVSNERRKANAIKRGGAYQVLSLDAEYAEDRYLKDIVEDPSALNVFERGWAATLLDQVKLELRDEYIRTGKKELYEALHGFLGAESSRKGYGEVADKLNMKTGTVTVAVHRLRHKYGQLLRQAVADTLTDPTPSEIDAELKYLMNALSGQDRASRSFMN